MQQQGKQVRIPKVPGYEVMELIGRGANGVVFRARQEMMDRLVALKILSPRLAADEKFKARFIREARASAKFNHPNVVQGYDVGEVGNTAYFAMEYVDGASLGELLKQGRRFEWREVLQITQRMAEALKHAADVGMIHRDIKPDNILLGDDGTPKLVDLGLARTITGGGDSANPQQVVANADAALTQAGSVLGTPHYLAPEQARGRTDIDGRADIYSLGATVYHLLTGEVMFPGLRSHTAMMAHVRDCAAPPQDAAPDTPDRFVQVLAMMTAKNPDDRYPDAGELVRDLNAVAAGRVPPLAKSFKADSSIPPAIPRRARTTAGTPSRERDARAPAAKSSTGLLVGIGTGVVVGVVLTAFMLISGSGNEPARAEKDVAVSTVPPATEPQRDEQAERRARLREALDNLRAVNVDNPLEFVETWWDQRDTFADTALQSQWQSGYNTAADKAQAYLAAHPYRRLVDLQGRCSAEPLRELWQQAKTTVTEQLRNEWAEARARAESHLDGTTPTHGIEIVGRFVSHPLNDVAAEANDLMKRLQTAVDAAAEQAAVANAEPEQSDAITANPLEKQREQYRRYREVIAIASSLNFQDAAASLQQWKEQTSYPAIKEQDIPALEQELDWLRKVTVRACQKLVDNGTRVDVGMGQPMQPTRVDGLSLKIRSQGVELSVQAARVPWQTMLQTAPWTADEAPKLQDARYCFWRDQPAAAEEALAAVGESADSQPLRERVELLREGPWRLWLPPTVTQLTASLPESFTTPAGTAPAGVEAADVDLTWEPGRDGDGKARGMRIERSINDGPWNPIAELEAGQTDHTDEGAPLDSMIRYRVVAWNDLGDAEGVAEATVQTPAKPIEVAEVHEEAEEAEEEEGGHTDDVMDFLDENNDGVLTRNEIPEHLRDFFGFVDQNNDGQLSGSELRKIEKMLNRRGNWGRGRGRGRGR